MSIRASFPLKAIVFLILLMSSLFIFAMVYRHWGSLANEVMFHWVIPIIAVLLIGELWFEYKQHQIAQLRLMLMEDIERQKREKSCP